MPKPQIILASSSPRRIELLKNSGFSPRVLKPDTDETRLDRENPRSMVARLAREKAEDVALRLIAEAGTHSNEGPMVIIAADTTVVAPGGKKELGKPRDKRDAARMLRQLSGTVHTVLTGYCILSLKRSGKSGPFSSHLLVRVVTSKVRMRKLSARDIDAYIATGEPMDKAGSYGAQGIGMTLIESLSGSYSNVVGLPVAQVLQDLSERFGVRAR